VPTDLVGKPEAVARQRLVALGLVPQTSRRVAPAAPAGTVLDTEPGGGSIVDKGTEVLLIVAVAPPPTPSSKGPTANASVPAPN
jgi:beta-lactam-binding protein with PASTA domain